MSDTAAFIDYDNTKTGRIDDERLRTSNDMVDPISKGPDLSTSSQLSYYPQISVASNSSAPSSRVQTNSSINNLMNNNSIANNRFGVNGGAGGNAEDYTINEYRQEQESYVNYQATPTNNQDIEYMLNNNGASYQPKGTPPPVEKQVPPVEQRSSQGEKPEQANPIAKTTTTDQQPPVKKRKRRTKAELEQIASLPPPPPRKRGRPKRVKEPVNSAHGSSDDGDYVNNAAEKKEANYVISTKTNRKSQKNDTNANTNGNYSQPQHDYAPAVVSSPKNIRIDAQSPSLSSSLSNSPLPPPPSSPSSSQYQQQQQQQQQQLPLQQQQPQPQQQPQQKPQYIIANNNNQYPPFLPPPPLPPQSPSQQVSSSSSSSHRHHRHRQTANYYLQQQSSQPSSQFAPPPHQQQPQYYGSQQQYYGGSGYNNSNSSNSGYSNGSGYNPNNGYNNSYGSYIQPPSNQYCGNSAPPRFGPQGFGTSAQSSLIYNHIPPEVQIDIPPEGQFLQQSLQQSLRMRQYRMMRCEIRTYDNIIDSPPSLAKFQLHNTNLNAQSPIDTPQPPQQLIQQPMQIIQQPAQLIQQHMRLAQPADDIPIASSSSSNRQYKIASQSPQYYSQSYNQPQPQPPSYAYNGSIDSDPASKQSYHGQPPQPPSYSYDGNPNLPYGSPLEPQQPMQKAPQPPQSQQQIQQGFTQRPPDVPNYAGTNYVGQHGQYYQQNYDNTPYNTSNNNYYYSPTPMSSNQRGQFGLPPPSQSQMQSRSHQRHGKHHKMRAQQLSSTSASDDDTDDTDSDSYSSSSPASSSVSSSSSSSSDSLIEEINFSQTSSGKAKMSAEQLKKEKKLLQGSVNYASPKAKNNAKIDNKTKNKAITKSSISNNDTSNSTSSNNNNSGSNTNNKAVAEQENDPPKRRRGRPKRTGNAAELEELAQRHRLEEIHYQRVTSRIYSEIENRDLIFNPFKSGLEPESHWTDYNFDISFGDLVQNFFKQSGQKRFAKFIYKLYDMLLLTDKYKVYQDIINVKWLSTYVFSVSKCSIGVLLDIPFKNINKILFEQNGKFKLFGFVEVTQENFKEAKLDLFIEPDDPDIIYFFHKDLRFYRHNLTTSDLNDLESRPGGKKPGVRGRPKYAGNT